MGYRASGLVFIDGQLISGNRPYDEFMQMIDGFLSQTAEK
jgi:hypothetical protein